MMKNWLYERYYTIPCKKKTATFRKSAFTVPARLFFAAQT